MNFSKLFQFQKQTNSDIFAFQGDVGDGDDVDMKPDDDTEGKEENPAEVPMLHLASFALHKLFTEWQAEGFDIPDFKAGGGHPISTDAAETAEATPVAPAQPVNKTTVPENANSIHPTTLLCMVSIILNGGSI